MHKKIVPERDVTVGLVMLADDLAGAAKRLDAVGDGTGVFSYGERNDFVSFTSNGSKASGEERVPVEPAHRDVEPTAIDLKNLLALIKARGDDDVELSFLRPNSPVSVFPEDGDGVHLIMPQRVDD